MMELKPQDLLVLLKQVAQPEAVRTYAVLGQELGISASQAHRSVQRCLTAGLAVSAKRGEWQVVRSALLEFVVHGVRYAFPAVLGPVKRGVATSFGAEPLSIHLRAASGEAPVWPHPTGHDKGPSVSPLCPTAPAAALADPELHKLLALVDALRMGRARERNLARQLLTQALGVTDDAR